MKTAQNTISGIPPICTPPRNLISNYLSSLYAMSDYLHCGQSESAPEVMVEAHQLRIFALERLLTMIFSDPIQCARVENGSAFFREGKYLEKN
jgi:hypothetical protein